MFIIPSHRTLQILPGYFQNKCLSFQSLQLCTQITRQYLDVTMRRTSGGPPPLRVRNEGNEPPSGSRSRFSSGSRPSTESRLSSGSRSSFGARLSFGYGNGIASRRSSNLPLGKTRGGASAGGPPSKRRASTRHYGHELKSDPRPITERRFKDACIRNLVEFLSQNGYAYPCSSKILHAPPSKDFVRIFEFMYGKLVPGFKVANKIEEQFPQFMKAWGYPFPISKSAMYAVGSPHMWPNILAALDWLRQVIQSRADADVDKKIFPYTENDDSDDESMSKVVFRYCEETYHQFLQGHDSFDELSSELQRKIRKRCPGGDMDSLVHEKRRLQQELDNLQEQPDPLIDLKDGLAAMNLDIEKMRIYQQQMENHCTLNKGKLDTLEKDLEQSVAEMETLKVDNRKKQVILETQTFSQADVYRIRLERKTLTENIEAVEREYEELEKLIWEQERLIAKDQEKIQKQCATYNNLASLSHLIPATEENAHGIDYELHHSLESSHGARFVETVKPALTQFRNQLEDKVYDVEEAKIKGQIVIDQLNDNISEKEDANSNSSNQLTFAERELERIRTLQQQECQRLQVEIESVQAELFQQHASQNTDLSQLEREVREEEKRYHQVCDDHIREKKKCVKFMNQAAKLMLDHKSKIQEHSKLVAADLKKKAQEFRDRDIS